MAECRRCGNEISAADVQKGRALQRGEFWYCPTCVADARAAKGAPAAAAAAPASRVASGALKAPPSGAVKAAPSGGVRAAASGSQRMASPGSSPGMKPAPPSSTKMKPAPAPASRKVAAPPPQEELLDDEPQEEEQEEAPAPGRGSGRGPASSRMGRAAGPGSGKMKKPSGPPPPMEEQNLRKKIGFKDGSAGVKPMSKQTLMMWGVGGAAVFAIAFGVFFTLIIKRGREHVAVKENLEQCKEKMGAFDRIFREKPKDFQGIDDALEDFHKVAEHQPKYKAELEDRVKAVARRKDHAKSKKEAIELLTGLNASLGTVEGCDEVLKKVRKALKLVAAVDWVSEDEKRDWFDRLLGVLKAARTAAEASKAAEKKDVVLIGSQYVVAKEVAAVMPPEVFNSTESQALTRDADEAIDKRYEDPAFLERFTWQDFSGADIDMKSDDWVTVSRGADGITLTNTDSSKAGLFYLNKKVLWQDYIMRVDFECNEAAFQIMQRLIDDKPAAVTHDLEILMKQGQVFKPNEKISLSFMVYASKNRVFKDAIPPNSRPQRNSTQGAPMGGFSFRIPVGGKVVIHKLELKVMRESDEDAAPPKSEK